MNRAFRTTAIVLVLFVLTAASFAQVPASHHVIFIVEENQSYSSIIGNSSLPYINGLAQKYGLATNYYGNTHPSIGNYFMMTTGQIITNDDNYTATLSSSVDNIVRRVVTAGKTWKSYGEGLPSTGYTGGNTGYYLKRHNPFAYLSDVANSSSEVLNLVGTNQLLTDLANNQLPNLSFIVPNIMDDAHNGTPQQMDSWLSQYVPKILANPGFQQDGILFITFDESFTSDTAYGGGHVVTIVISPKGKSGYKSTTLYQHQSLLKTMLMALGLNTSLGAAASAPDMGEFFTSPSAPVPPAPQPPSPQPPQPTPPPVVPTQPMSFQMSANPANPMAHSGQPVAVDVTLTPQSGFSGTVQLTCAGLPAGASCSWSSNPVMLSNGPVSSTLTITMNSVTSALRHERRQPQPFLAFSLPVFGLVAGSFVKRDRRKKIHGGFWLVLGLVLTIALLCIGCGGGSQATGGLNPGASPIASGTTAHSYTVTITGVSGAMQQSTTVVVSVN